jgi:hypothetical protein
MDIVADHFNSQDGHNGVALSADLHLKGALHKRSRDPSSERLESDLSQGPRLGMTPSPATHSRLPPRKKKNPLAPFPVRAGLLRISRDYQK